MKKCILMFALFLLALILSVLMHKEQEIVPSQEALLSEKIASTGQE